MTRIFKKAALIILIIISTIVLLELGAKVLLKSIFKDKIIAQNLQTEFEEIYIPPFGKKEPDEFRIFVYGGSTVQGIPTPKTGFVNQLQYQLNHVFEGRSVRVYNFGWAGYNSTRIRYSLSRTILADPDLIIVYTGENEFIYPQLDSYFLVRTATFVKNHSDLGKIVLHTIKSGQGESVKTSADKFPAYASNKFYVHIKKQIFQNNLRAIVREAKKSQIPLVLGIPAHNIADWPPVRREVTTQDTPIDYKEGYATVKKLIGQDNLVEAENLVDSLLSKYPQDASLIFQKATILRKKGEPSLAVFQKAKDNDLVPWRTTTAYADFLKSLEDRKNVWVINFARIFQNNSKDGLPGFDFFVDGTHPSKEGAYLITNAIVDFVISEKLINPDWLVNINPFYPQEELFEAMEIDEVDDFSTYLSSATLALKIPLLNPAAAKYFAQKAEKIDNTNWQTKAVLASAAHLEGNDKQAEIFLYEAEIIKGSAISDEDARFIPYLSEILKSSGSN